MTLHRDEESPAVPEQDQPANPDAAASTEVAMAGVIGTRWSRAARVAALVGVIVLLGVTQGLSMLIVVAAIVIMLFLHELGHYLMAKRAGMLVTEFFLGFGPRIWSFHRGETEYGIKAIPAGAYVRIVGMNSMEEVDPALESRTYRQGTFSQRLGVAVAGSTMHFLLALVLLFVQFAFISDPTSPRWEVAQVTEASAAEAAGLRVGDRIVALGGQPVESFEEFRDAVATSDAGATDATIERDGTTVVLPVELSQRMKLIGTIGEDLDVVDNGESVVLAAPVPDGRIAEQGIVGGEQVLEVNGTPVDGLEAVVRGVEESESGTVDLVLSSGGEHRSVAVDLGSAVDTTEPGAFFGVGSRGAGETRSLPGAAVGAVRTFGDISWLSIQGVGKFLWPPNMLGFVTDALSGGPSGDPADAPTSAAETPSQVSETRPISIIGVAMIGSDLSAENLSHLVLFLAQINIFIGVFNLFPLLPFDGGHVVIAFYEKSQELRRRTTQRYMADVSRMLPVAYGVVIVLVVIGLLAVFMDVTRGFDI